MNELKNFVPLRLVLTGWPTTILGLPPQIDQIGLSELETTSAGASSLIADGTCQLLVDIEFDLPLIPGLSLVAFNEGDFTELDFGIEVLTDWFRIELSSISAALRFDTQLLKRMERSGNGYVEALDPVTEAPQPIEISLTGADLAFNSKGEFSLSGAVPSLTIQPFMIADTGVIIDIQSLQLILSDEAAGALPASIDPSWRGIFLEQAAIRLPEGLNDILPDDVLLEDFFIGAGGFCGRVTGAWTVDPADPFDADAGDIFGFQFRLTSIDLEFKQNALLGSSLKGYLNIPFFEEVLEIGMGLTSDGDLTIAISSNDGLLVLEKDGVISIELDSLAFSREDGEFALVLTGRVTPLLAGLNWPSFDLNGLSIRSDGQVRVDGGWITLPELKTLDFHGFKIEISQLGFGSEADGADDFNWVGFSGGIQLVAGLPLRGGVEGLKVMWNKVSNAPKLKISGVSLAFEIENILNFDGVAFFIDEDRGFKGGVKVGLVPLNGAGFDAQFITGDAGTFKYFYLFLDLSLPVGVPVLPPALGLYGIAGLFAYNMTLDYPALIDYQGEGARPDMTDVANWIVEEDALAFGAGVTVGTLADNGFTVKAKAVLAILIPGPVILIEGHTKVLSFGDNYPYRVLAVLDIASGTFLMNIDVSYAFPKNSGDLLDIGGAAEAYFPAGDLSGWHLYLGQDKPESKRLRAGVISFFTADAYFMVDQDGLAFGVWIGYSLDEKYAVLRVVLESWISGSLAVSWMPLQALGSFTWHGRAELSVGKIGLGVSVEATASVEVPKPIALTGSLTVQLKTPVGKPKATIKIKWEKEGTPPYPIPLAANLGIEHRKAAENWNVSKASKYGTDGDGLWDGTDGQVITITEEDLPLVPPDVQLVLNFDKSMIDTALAGGNNPDVPPVERSGAYEYQYELLGIELAISETWNDAPDTLTWLPFEDAGSDFQFAAAWQAAPDPKGMKNTKLVVNATSSLEISRLLEDNSYWLYQIALYNPDYPCIDLEPPSWTTVNFEGYEPDTVLFPEFVLDGWGFISDFPMRVLAYDAPWLGTSQAIKTDEELELVRCLLILEEPASGQQNLLLTKGLEIRAATHPSAFVEYRTEPLPVLDYLRHTELYINESRRIPALGVAPAYISFPAAEFPSWPDKVWLTLMVDVTPDTLMIARDGSGFEVDRIDEFSDCSRNPHTYLLQSDKGNPIRTVEFIGSNFQIKKLCWNEYRYAETSRVWINLPEEMAELHIHLSKGSEGDIFFIDDQDTELESVEFSIPDDGTNGPAAVLELDVSHLAFKLILIRGSFELIQVDGLAQAALDAYNDQVLQSTHYRTFLEENWGKHSAQILLPNTFYRLKVETASSRRKTGNSAWSTVEFTEYMYFRTGNPAGIDAETQETLNEAGSYPAGGPLKDLGPYIERTIPAGAPPNEAQTLHFRSYDVGAVFNDSYIEQMYHAAGFDLGIKLLDNNMQVVKNADGEEIFQNGWADNPTRSLTREETQYETLWSAENCYGVSTTDPESNQELLAGAPSLNLLPQTQYKAQIWAGGSHLLYEFPFLTSRYASFLHQIHDFQDAVWDHHRLLDDPSFSVDAIALEAVLLNSGNTEEWIRAEQLMAIFDLNPRSLPDRLEITLLNDGTQSYGLLMESPEPIPAERVPGIVLSRADVTNGIDEFFGPVKLVSADLRKTTPDIGSADLNRQSIEILLLEEADLEGYQVEYRALSAGEAAPFTVFYTFGPNSVFPPGTRLLIYNGSDPGTVTEETEWIKLYAAHSAQSFFPAGTSIRFADPDGNTVHQRPFFRDLRYAEQDIQLIRNQDETRLFLFIRENGSEYSALTQGIYRIAFTYLRDAGGDLPLLKRFGASEPEEGQIEFSLPALLP